MTASSGTKKDWRTWTPVVKDYPGTGSPALSADCTGGETVEFNAPSVAALCLSIARKAYRDALDRKKSLCACKDAQALDALAYDYLESVMVSVMFSETAIEAFANAIIGQSDAIGRRYEAETNIEKVERKKLDEKLKKILPDLIPGSITPKALWTKYEAMKQLRNDWVVHAKTEWMEKGGTLNRYSKEFWNKLLSADMPENYPETAETMMKWFVGNLDCWLNRV
jgi:hypothetical protein